MQYRKLGKTGLTVSVIGIGTWQLGGEWGHDFSQSEVDAIFDAAREEGVTLVDTAACYGPRLAESLVGGAIHRDRERWVLATKFGLEYTTWLKRDEDYSAPAMELALEKSLRTLQTDYLDLFQVHGVSPATAQDGALWEALERVKVRGLVRAIGVSIRFDPASLAPGAIDVAQIIYNRLNRTAEETVFPICRERGLGVLARVPLASGLLSGKYKPGHRWAETDVRTTRPAEELARDILEAQRIAGEEVPAGVPMAAWALAWCLHNPVVSAVIPGCKSPEQLRANAAAADLEIGQAGHPWAV